MALKKLTKINHYLSFRLGGETYAIDVANAREIVECSTVTQIPKTPPWIRGVINLRGRVVPVIDLKMRFDMGATEETVNTCVIVVETVVDGEMFVVGLLADAAKEVFELDDTSLDPPPKFGVKVNTHYIRGMARRGDDLLVVLDAERVLSLHEVSEAVEIAGEADADPETKNTDEDDEAAPSGVDAGWDVAPDSPSDEPKITISQGA